MSQSASLRCVSVFVLTAAITMKARYSHEQMLINTIFTLTKKGSWADISVQIAFLNVTSMIVAIALLACYAAYVCSFWHTFRNSLDIPFPRIKQSLKMEPMWCPETSVSPSPSWPELHRGGNQISRTEAVERDAFTSSQKQMVEAVGIA
jgi:hypothetical protein